MYLLLPADPRLRAAADAGDAAVCRRGGAGGSVPLPVHHRLHLHLGLGRQHRRRDVMEQLPPPPAGRAVAVAAVADVSRVDPHLRQDGEDPKVQNTEYRKPNTEYQIHNTEYTIQNTQYIIFTVYE